jgi:acetyltransferase-like isoleucine patch superfamily enzyme
MRGISELWKKGRPVLAGKWRLRSCNRVGRLPRVLGKPYIRNDGEIVIGDKLILFSHVAATELVSLPGGKVEIGNNVFINYGSSIGASELVKIGDGCQIGSHAIIMDNDYHQAEDKTARPESEPVILEKQVWLGVRVTILKGVKIGEGAVVAAGSVVTKDVAPRTLVAGVPARVIKKF